MVRSAANHQGIAREFDSVWKVVILSLVLSVDCQLPSRKGVIIDV